MKSQDLTMEEAKRLKAKERGLMSKEQHLVDDNAAVDEDIWDMEMKLTQCNSEVGYMVTAPN